MHRQINHDNASTNNDQMVEISSLLSLPPELLNKILVDMPISSIIRFARVTKEVRKRLLEGNTHLLSSSFWEKQLGDYFPDVRKNVTADYAKHFIENYVQAIKSLTPYLLEKADLAFKKDHAIVLAVVRRYGWALQYADASLKADPEVVLAAVTQYGWALVHADESLKADPKIVLAAMTQNGWALRYADANLRKDNDLLRLASILNDAARATACDEYAHSISFIKYSKASLLNELTRQLQQPGINRAAILDLFEEIKDPTGKYKAIHQQTNVMWDTLRLRLFQFNSNKIDTKPFWHTAAYQKAVGLLKEAYVLCGDNDQTDKDRKDDAKDLIDYHRHNIFNAAKETETRRKLPGKANV